MRYGFGADVGGTTVKLGFFDETGKRLESREIPTRTENCGEAILPDIAAAVEDILKTHGIEKKDVLGIGIGVPGAIYDDGELVRCVNIGGWGGFNLHKELTRLTGLPAKAGNDANVAALGEYWKGGGEGFRSVLFVTLGTGIGGGIIIDDRILTGAHGAGGEIGHIRISAPDQHPCTCGCRGCVEQYASANGIARVTKERLAEFDGETSLRSVENLTCKDVCDAAKQGDAFAVETLEIVFDYLAEALASAACVCDPECIILGGGVSKAGTYLTERVAAHFERHRFYACKGTKFVLATLGNDAGMYGAFRLMQTNR